MQHLIRKIIHRRNNDDGYYDDPLFLFIFNIPFILVFALFLISIDLEIDIIENETKRQPLSASQTIETEYYTDKDNYIRHEEMMTDGMKEFYDATGVQPYVIIADNSNSKRKTKDDKVNKWMDTEYDKLFEDEGHLLLTIIEENDEFNYWLKIGEDAKKVIDAEAEGYLKSYLDDYLNNNKWETEATIGQIFESASESTMIIHKEPKVEKTAEEKAIREKEQEEFEETMAIIFQLCIIAGILIIVIVAYIFGKEIYDDKKREKEWNEQVEFNKARSVVNTPIDKLMNKSNKNVNVSFDYDDPALREILKKYGREYEEEIQNPYKKQCRKVRNSKGYRSQWRI